MNSVRRIARGNRRGFTLVELLVVIAILGILSAILIPALTGMIERGNRAKSSGNLRQIGAAFLAYATEHNGYLPPPMGRLSSGQPAQQLWWPIHLLPFTGGETKIFDRPGLNKTWNDPEAVNPENGQQVRMGYWINGGADPNVAFAHAHAFISTINSGKNYFPLVGFARPAQTIALIDGIAGSAANLWNPDSRGKWRSGENSKYHRWSGEKVDGNGLNAQGKVPEGSFNVLWLDGHVSLEKSSTLKTEDFLREK